MKLAFNWQQIEYGRYWKAVTGHHGGTVGYDVAVAACQAFGLIPRTTVKNYVQQRLTSSQT